MNTVLDAIRKAGVVAKEFIDGTTAQSKNLIIKNAFATGSLCSMEIKKSLQYGIVYFLRKCETYKLKSVILRSEFTSTKHNRFSPNDGNLPPHLIITPFDLECTGMMAFRRIMEEYNITPSMIIESLLSGDLRDFENPAKSGSLFYLTADDEYILKTVRDYEARFFQSDLLNDYYHNLALRKKSFLGRYFGMYAYTQRGSLLTFRFVIMSNIIPCSLPISERYDLKGSTKGRKVMLEESFKQQPTYKDLDFIARYPNGLQLPPDVYDRLSKTLCEDVEILRDWNIIDYSLLIGIYNLSNSTVAPRLSALRTFSRSVIETASTIPNMQNPSPGWNLMGLNNVNDADNVVGWNCPIGRIYPDDMSSARMYNDPVALTYGGIPAMNDKCDKLMLFLGIVDILQTYDASKQVQQFVQGINDYDDYSRSIVDPEQYARRFLDFVLGKVFRRGQTDLGTTRMGSIDCGKFRLRNSMPIVVERDSYDVIESTQSQPQAPTLYPHQEFSSRYMSMTQQPYPLYSDIHSSRLESQVNFRNTYSAPNFPKRETQNYPNYNKYTSQPSYPLIDQFPNAEDNIRKSSLFSTSNTTPLPPPQLPADYESKLLEFNVKSQNQEKPQHIGFPPLPDSFSHQDSHSNSF